MGEFSRVRPVRRRRALLRVGAMVAAAMVLGSLLVVAAPPAQATVTSIRFVAVPFTVTRGGVQYQVRVEANRFDASDQGLTVRFTEVEGGAAREVGYQGPTTFRVGDDFASGSLRPTAAQMGDHGVIDMRWRPSEPSETVCDGHHTIRRGRFKGTFSFDSGDPLFGTIQREKLRGTMRFEDGPCRQDVGACPASQLALGAGNERSDFWAVKKPNRAAIRASRAAEIGGGWWRVQVVRSPVPPDDIKANGDLTVVKVSGNGGSWMDGTSTLSAASPKETDRFRCRPAKRAVHEYNEGVFSPGLTVDFIIGRDGALSGPGWVQRSSTRDL